jgi:AraC-like DNA-binding protein
MPATKLIDTEFQGEVRFHSITPELWIMEARNCAHCWRVFHETYSFCLVLRIDGRIQVDWRYNHRLYVADPLHAMAMQPGELHANLDRTPPADFIVVQVSDRLMKDVARELGWCREALNLKHSHTSSDHPQLLNALRRFHSILCADLFDSSPGRGICTCWTRVERHMEILAELVAVFIRECAEESRDIGRPGKGAAQITRALEYLRAHYNEPYSLKLLANAARCTPSLLSHTFSEVMGMTPWAFQNRILVAKAQGALAAAPEKYLHLIATELGWPGRSGLSDNGAHLMIRQFAKTFGTTPDKFRAALRRIPRTVRRAYTAPRGVPLLRARSDGAT